jgi:hypothetical protein
VTCIREMKKSINLIECGVCGLNSSGSEQRPVVGLSELGSKPKSSTIYGEFLDKQSNY